MNSQAKALIIDDEVELCFLLSRILRNHGIEVSYVNSLSDAKSMLTFFTPSVIFLDNHLPDGLGIEFLRYLKGNYPDIKIFIITAKEASRDQALQNGANDVIFKPFTSERIFSAMENYI